MNAFADTVLDARADELLQLLAGPGARFREHQREAGEGPTLLISPLLALMRNQIDATRRLGLRAETVNSTNREDWDAVRDLLDRDEVDLLLISPERLKNRR